MLLHQKMVCNTWFWSFLGQHFYRSVAVWFAKLGVGHLTEQHFCRSVAVSEIWFAIPSVGHLIGQHFCIRSVAVSEKDGLQLLVLVMGQHFCRYVSEDGLQDPLLYQKEIPRIEGTSLEVARSKAPKSVSGHIFKIPQF
jgi:hypothetical protein